MNAGCCRMMSLARWNIVGDAGAQGCTTTIRRVKFLALSQGR
jgi:hypothetical protein